MTMDGCEVCGGSRGTGGNNRYTPRNAGENPRYTPQNSNGKLTDRLMVKLAKRVLAGDLVLWLGTLSALAYLVGAILAYTELNTFTEIPPGWYLTIGVIVGVLALITAAAWWGLRNIKREKKQQILPEQAAWWNTLLMYILVLFLAGLSMFLLALVFIVNNQGEGAFASPVGFTFALPVPDTTVNPAKVEEFLKITGTWMLMANVNFSLALIVMWALAGLFGTMWTPISGAEEVIPVLARVGHRAWA